MLTNLQVLSGTTSVARLGEVVVWFETGPDGGGVMLTQLLQALQGVASGPVPSRQMGARLAAVLNTGDAQAVPAMVAATPEENGLRVVVHGWGAVVADGVHVPNGWADQLIPDRRTFFIGRNTVTPVTPTEGASDELEGGVVPGDGLSFSLGPSPGPASTEHHPSEDPAPMAAPTAWPPPPAPAVERARKPVHTRRPPAAARAGAGPARLGRLVLDDGSEALLERTSVLGSAPHASSAVQTEGAIPLTVVGPGVAEVHAEVRVDQGGVAVRVLGPSPTHLLAPGAPAWIPLEPGQLTSLTPGTRIALGQRTLSYERP